VGVEATNDQKLKEFKKETGFEDSRQALKLIRDAGMIVESSLILGTPNETAQSVKQTLALAREYNADFMHFLLLAPWPYADMYESLKPYIEVTDYSKYNLVEPVIKPHAMTRAQLMNEVLNCYKQYYMGKLPQWANMKDNPLKRSCLIKGMKAIIENSFLKDHMKGLGGMPKGVRELIKHLQP
jgi:anaerobic magnesium-protoporphyrin IX monomethyl ester cyclase